MPGFDTGSVMYALNVDFTGNSLTSGTAQVTTNGQLLIGSTATPNIKVGTLSSIHSSMTVSYNSPNINLEVTGANTNGIPLVSNGAGNPPIYNTAVVAGGGTGDTSFVAYTPVCGGTSTTGPLQSVASIGTSGQVLTSNGAAALPTFQAVTPSSTFAPNGTLLIWDDFVGASMGIQTFSNFFWSGLSGAYAGSGQLLQGGHPGVFENVSLGASALMSLIMAANSTGGGITLGGGVLTINWVFNIRTLSTGTNTYDFYVGLGDTVASGTDQSNGCYIYYNSGVNSGNWVYKTASASSRTATNSSTAVTTGWHNAQIVVNAAASSVTYFMDGVSLGTAIATNIPTTQINPFIIISRTAGTIAANSLSVDLVYVNYTLTSAR